MTAQSRVTFIRACNITSGFSLQHYLASHDCLAPEALRPLNILSGRVVTSVPAKQYLHS